ncbi:hypothetical protein [Burkholderia gladioli]|uniref:hypothetical protein n=1 Tax=Burkholderia gladioli TaxID=28095 RepID=UPI001641EC96|nr:hypothetical protein [Burkholderia gladioli]
MTISPKDGLNHDVDDVERYILAIARSTTRHDKEDFADVLRASQAKERADLSAAADEAAPEPAPSRPRARL